MHTCLLPLVVAYRSLPSSPWIEITSPLQNHNPHASRPEPRNARTASDHEVAGMYGGRPQGSAGPGARPPRGGSTERRGERLESPSGTRGSAARPQPPLRQASRKRPCTREQPSRALVSPGPARNRPPSARPGSPPRPAAFLPGRRRPAAAAAPQQPLSQIVGLSLRTLPATRLQLEILALSQRADGRGQPQCTLCLETSYLFAQPLSVERACRQAVVTFFEPTGQFHLPL
jgi:hypothetical protein